MKKLNVIGQIFNASGYASHTYQLCELLSTKYDLRINCPLPPNYEVGIPDWLLNATKKELHQNSPVLCIGLPTSYLIKKNETQASKFFCYVVWEGTQTPLYWNEYLAHCDCVLVPS